MKYILLLLLFAACTQPESRKTTVVMDSLPMVTGGIDTTMLRLRIGPVDSTGITAIWNGTTFSRIRIAFGATHLNYFGDSSITIKGDTMLIIRQMLESMERAFEKETKLYNENLELRKVIEQMIKEKTEVLYTNK
jgi:hypothetical protein